MASVVRVTGGEQLVVLAGRLRGAPKEMRRLLPKGMTQATKSLKKAAKANAVATLPQRGGLGRRVARTKMTTRTRTGLHPSVDILAKPGAVADPGRIDRGRIKHPVWGRGPWVLQDVTPGWFSKPMAEGWPMVEPDVQLVLDAVSARIGRGL